MTLMKESLGENTLISICTSVSVDSLGSASGFGNAAALQEDLLPLAALG